ncbi:MAG TPA: heparan-alpha-glucosaminide N-acetyltransferase domain-containing protein [Xanthomonadales bacterium]|nr:heparan-alpha-glucosaminide N-acetyltransferase domain-containing protein [Xanthomonadales bacterium]
MVAVPVPTPLPVPLAGAGPAYPTAAVARIEAIDVLRGIVIVLMVLDHVRDYFTAYRFGPLDPEKTWATLYATRWVTHFCAPLFVLLSGVSIRLMAARVARGALALFLLKRGSWLVLLEVVVVSFLWSFRFDYGAGIFLQVIWAIGASMVAMAALVHLPPRIVAAIGVAIVAGHHLLDGVDGTAYGVAWTLPFAPGPLGGVGFVAYPFVPWLGIMAAGYGVGGLYALSAPQRRRALLLLGLALVVAFAIGRTLNGYGDPRPWVPQADSLRTAFAFMDVTKYPPSLWFACATIGPGLVALALLERARGPIAAFFATYGRVPLFAYLLHIAVVHLLAGLVGLATGHGTAIIGDAFFNYPDGWGYGLRVVYPAWILVIALLYLPCRWYGRKKARGTSRLYAYL